VVNCFTAYSTVELVSGARVRMDQLQVGDRVLSVDDLGQLAHSPVVAFTSVYPNRSGSAVHIEFGHQGRISLSPIHLLFVSDSAVGAPRDEQAMHVRPGMYLWSLDARDKSRLEPAMVASVTFGEETGWFTPLTASGTLIVDGVLASCHTTGPHGLVRVMYAPWQWWLHYFPAPLGLPFVGDNAAVPFYSRVLRRGVVGSAVEWLLRGFFEETRK
jgi:hypothetical protein